MKWGQRWILMIDFRQLAFLSSRRHELPGCLTSAILWFPTALLLGFNLVGRGVDACSRKPEHWWNLAVLEPCCLLDPCWTLAGPFLKPGWNLAGTLVGHCWKSTGTWWNLAGTLLLEPLAGISCWEPMQVWISFFVYCFLLCLMCRVVMLEA